MHVLVLYMLEGGLLEPEARSMSLSSEWHVQGDGFESLPS